LFACTIQAENRARDEAIAVFKEQLLGRRQAEALQAQLDAAITKEAKAKRTANVAESNVVCQSHEMKCAKLLASMSGGLQIPSMRQFEGRYKACLATFEVRAAAAAVCLQVTARHWHLFSVRVHHNAAAAAAGGQRRFLGSMDNVQIGTRALLAGRA
jgi:hypothetical protein